MCHSPPGVLGLCCLMWNPRVVFRYALHMQTSAWDRRGEEGVVCKFRHQWLFLWDSLGVGCYERPGDLNSLLDHQSLSLSVPRRTCLNNWPGTERSACILARRLTPVNEDHLGMRHAREVHRIFLAWLGIATDSPVNNFRGGWWSTPSSSINFFPTRPQQSPPPWPGEITILLGEIQITQASFGLSVAIAAKHMVLSQHDHQGLAWDHHAHFKQDPRPGLNCSLKVKDHSFIR